jgi:hypothetical protein
MCKVIGPCKFLGIGYSREVSDDVVIFILCMTSGLMFLWLYVEFEGGKRM